MLKISSLATPLLTAITTSVLVQGGAIAPSQAAPAPLVLQHSSLSEWVAQVSARQALAQHLTNIGARMYGAYWCPYCNRQEQLFGDAFEAIDYVECDSRGANARPQLCREAGIQGYPTWEINGQLYPGMQTLETLADLSNYTGSTDF